MEFNVNFNNIFLDSFVKLQKPMVSFSVHREHKNTRDLQILQFYVLITFDDLIKKNTEADAPSYKAEHPLCEADLCRFLLCVRQICSAISGCTTK